MQTMSLNCLWVLNIYSQDFLMEDISLGVSEARKSKSCIFLFIFFLHFQALFELDILKGEASDSNVQFKSHFSEKKRQDLGSKVDIPELIILKYLQFVYCGMWLSL